MIQTLCGGRVAELVSEVLAVQHMAHVAIAAMLASSSLCPLHMRSSNTLEPMVEAV